MTSPAIQLARECGGHGGSVTMVFDIQELETFYARAQAQALREAAYDMPITTQPRYWLHCMADEKEKKA